MPPKVKAPSSPKAALKKTKTQDINLAKEEPLRGKAARNDFLIDVSTASGVPIGDVKKCLDGLRKTIARQLRETNKCRVPTIASLKLKLTPAREESTQTIFGKEKIVKARPATKRIVVAPLKELKAAIQ